MLDGTTRRPRDASQARRLTNDQVLRQHVVERLGGLQTEPFRKPEVQTRTDFHTAGPPVLTGNHLDLSLEGTGFFALQTPDGVRYTRNLSLQPDASVRGMIEVIDRAGPGDTGRFLAFDGRDLPW